MTDTLNESSPEKLRAVAEYAERLAEYKERQSRLEAADETDDSEDPDDEFPENVPGKATVTIKEINDNRYNYSARSVVTTN